MAEDLIIEELRSVPLFSRLDLMGLNLIGSGCRLKRVSAGQPIVVEGEPGNALFIILSGRVEITRASSQGDIVFLAERANGDHFGEMTLIDGAPRSATVTAVETCRLLVLERTTLLHCIERNSQIAIAMLETMSARLREADQRQLGRSSIRERLLSFLAKEFETETGAPLTKGSTIRLRASRDEIGRRIGATRESVSREFSRLVDTGTLRVTGKQITMLNPTKFIQ